MLKRLFAGLVLTLPALSAQEGVINLEKWKVKAGDNPAWAAPDFDDRDWTPAGPPRGYLPSTSSAERSIRWYRTNVPVSPGLRSQALAIALSPLEEIFEVYVDGIRIGGIGAIDPVPVSRFEHHAAYSLPTLSANSETVSIAIRRWAGRASTNLAMLNAAGNGLGARGQHPPQLGPSALLHRQEALHWLQGERSATPRRAASWILLLAALLSFLLFYEQRDRREYLWLGLAMGCFGLFPLAGVVAVYLDLPKRSLIPALVCLGYSLGSAWISLFLRNLCPRVGGLMAGAAGVSVFFGLWLALSVWLNLDRSSLTTTWEAAISSGAQAIAACFLLLGGRQKRDAVLAASLGVFPLARVFAPFASRTFSWEGFVFDFRDLALVFSALSCLTVLYLRFRDEQKEQKRREQELAAGQRVQEFLLKRESAGNSLFEVGQAYLPAFEVGGDFYQTVSREDGGLLVVVGDVSGKGLEAAMRGATLLGALRMLRTLPPGEVLTRLNDASCDGNPSGFVTCCCALFAPDGTVTIANAGHPAPYADGRELDVEAGLPLGLAPGLKYAETIAQGNHFTFVSDGVVEAENTQRELFGFDRTREISGKSAQEIAEAAKAWGQNDDITVVTVRRVP